MPKAAEIPEIPATITERGQTTVPAAIRRMLDLGKRDRVVFRGLSDGTVVIAKKEDADAHEDPVIGKFLGFLASDMAGHPRRIRPVPRGMITRGRALVEGVTGDLGAALHDDDA